MEEEFNFNIDKLKVLKGGINEWINLGYPIETGAAVRPRGKLITFWGKIKAQK